MTRVNQLLWLTLQEEHAKRNTSGETVNKAVNMIRYTTTDSSTTTVVSRWM